jgi:hypothetical protein
MSKNWLRYILLSRKALWIFIVVMFLALSFTPAFMNRIYFQDVSWAVMGMAVIMDMVLAYILPELLFSFVHRRKSADQYFALPVSRKKILLTTFAFMFVLNYGLYLIVTGLCLLIFDMPVVNAGWFIASLLLTGLLNLVVLSVNTCWYLIANNIFDGVVMIAACSLLPLMISFMMGSFSGNLIAGDSLEYIPVLSNLDKYLSPLGMGSSLVMDSMSRAGTGMPYMDDHIICLVLLAVVLVISARSLRKNFIERRTERADQVSDRWSAYPLIIHLYLFCCLLVFSFTLPDGIVEILPWYLALLVCYVIGMSVYRRKVKITLKNLAVFFGGAALTAVFSFAAFKTEGFGIPYRYSLQTGEKLVYSMYGYYGNDGNGSQLMVVIPTDQIDQYRDVVDAMENFRHSAIHEVYDSSTRRKDSQGYLEVISLDEDDQCLRRYGYRFWKGMDEETEEILKKHPEVCFPNQIWMDPAAVNSFTLF